jgi:hypothetical protein
MGSGMRRSIVREWPVLLVHLHLADSEDCCGGRKDLGCWGSGKYYKTAIALQGHKSRQC